MKRAALILFLLGNACALTPQQTQSARSYGQKALEAYTAQEKKLAPGRAAVLACQKVVARVPDTVEECRLHLWGAQAVAEVITHDPVKHLGAVSRLWVGKMSGLPSDEQAERLTNALADDYYRWAKTPAAKDWFKQAAKAQGTRYFGYTVPCAVFSRQRLPVGVLNCVEGPGPGDGPTVTINLANGHTYDVGVR